MSTWIIASIIAAAFLFAIYRIYKNHKTGHCCGGCEGCASSKKCSPDK